MAGKIFIASKNIPLTSRQHLYLVFDADGNLATTNDEEVIRGGDVFSSNIWIEQGAAIGSSADAFGLGEDYSDRNFTEIDVSGIDTADNVWANMLLTVSTLGVEAIPGSIETIVPYHLLGPNSNSVVATVLYWQGLNISDTLPLTGGIGTEIPLGTFTAWNSFIGTAGNDSWTIDLSLPASRIVSDQGGDDTYTLDASTFASSKGVLTIGEISESGSDNVLIIENISVGDIDVYKSANGKDLIVVADGQVVSWIPGQFQSDYPLMSRVRAVPTVGSPADIAVDDPDALPFFHDRPLPTPVSGAIQPAFANAITAGSPLVIDLSSGHTGVTLTTWNATSTTTFFDLNDNGFDVQTAWVSGDTGLLARDLNSNGTIDSSAELFGSPTIDGFAKLAVLDSNLDLRIDNNDADWSTLVVWTDTNGDAATQSGELHSLASLNIASIDLAGVAASTSSISGNSVSHVSTVRFTSGATAAIADVWFKHDNTNSYYAGDIALDADTFFLPALRGYGTLPDLAIAMSQDDDLKELVADFIDDFSLSSFADAAGLQEDIEAILFRWAGVDGVDPDSRGEFMDARRLEFLEHFIGAPYYNTLLQSADPTPGPMVTLGPAYQAVFDMFAAALFTQIGGAALFSDAIQFNPFTGTYDGTPELSSTALDDLVNAAPSPGTANDAMWTMIVRYIESVQGIDNLNGTEETLLQDALAAADINLSILTVQRMIDPTLGAYNYINGTSGNDVLNGGSDKDSISGNDGNDTIHGYGGNDQIDGWIGDNTLYGDDGNDYLTVKGGNDFLYGGNGDDELRADQGTNTLNGGTGANILRAGSDADSYIYGDGQDLIIDAGGTDAIYLPSGITSGDLTFTRVSGQGSTSSFDDLLISIDGYKAIQIQNHYSGTSIGSGAVESIVFADTSTLNLTTLSNPAFNLTAGNDSLSTSLSGAFTVYGQDGDDTINLTGSGNHTVDGGNGNDTISSAGGNDTYIAGPGIDTINENLGTDTIVIPVGYDIDDVTFYRVLGSGGPTNHLGISIAGLGQIIVNNQFQGYSGYCIENLYFLDDSSTVTLTGMQIATVGTAGNDNLYPPNAYASADDFLDGREGNDNLYGGTGDDIYVFSAGNDKIDESAGGGADTIRVRDVYTTSDVTISFVQDTANNNNYNMQLTDTDGNTITVYRQGYASTNVVEHVAFAGGTTWNLSSMELVSYGTSGNDGISGHDYGDASSDDTIYALAGNDSIYAGAGNDTVYAGDGNDFVSTSDGTDTIYGGDGADDLHGNGYDVLYGNDGNDLLYSQPLSGEAATTLVSLHGGAGTDTLYGGYYGVTIENGGAGADTIECSGCIDEVTFTSDAFGAVDTVKYFGSQGADKLDVSDILDGYYDPLTDVLTDFVQIATNGSHSELYVDTTGTATFGSPQHIATLQYVTGMTNEAALVTAGTLVVA